MSSVAVEGIWMWECEMWEIRRGGKTAGPPGLQSTVCLAWSLCWSSQATSGSSHTSWLRAGNRPGFLSIQMSFWQLSREGSGSGNLLEIQGSDANADNSHLGYECRDSPPTGSLGLPVTNCRKSLCCSASKPLMTSNRNRTARLDRQAKNQMSIWGLSQNDLRLFSSSTSWPVVCVPVVWATTLHQRFDIPCLGFTATQQLFKL